MSVREREYHQLRAELAELDNLLSITAESAVIDRMSLERRRLRVEEELKANPPPPRWPATANLAFNGKPVVDREGVYSDFAGAAIGAFTEAVATLAASQESVLGERGVIPNRENYRLLVTGTSHGSFGFEIEEVMGPETHPSANESPVETAIGQATDILESLDSGEEEAIASAIADMDKRALDDLRKFLKVMADHEAVCSLSFKNKVSRFQDVGNVRRGLASLGRDNLHEDETEMVGRLQGFLPQARRAEFVDGKTGEVLSCRVDRGAGDESLTGFLGKNVRITARYRQVGNSRPRYTITECNLIQEP